MQTLIGDNRRLLRIGGLSAAIAIILAFLWIGTKSYSSHVAAEAQSTQLIASRIETLILDNRRTEKDFILRDLNNPQFYQTGETISLRKHQESLATLRKEIMLFASQLEDGSRETALDLLRLSDQYTESFFKLVAAYRERGDKEASLESEWKDLITDIEQTLSKQDNFGLFRLLLDLKKDEKDYVAGRQETQIDAVFSDIEAMRKAISKLSGSDVNRLTSDIDQYEAALKNHIVVNRKIGLSESTGFQADTRDTMQSMSTLVQKIQDDAVATMQTATRLSTTVFYICIAIGMGLLAALTYPLYTNKRSALSPRNDSDDSEDSTSSNHEVHLNGNGNGSEKPVASADNVTSPLLAMTAAATIENAHTGELS